MGTNMDQSDLIDKYLKRSYWIELFAGLLFVVFLIVLLALSLGVAGYQIKSNSYNLYLIFSDAGGLKKGASVELAGVQVGQVEDIYLDGVKAVVKISVSNKVNIREDDIFSVNTKGLIGDKFIKISPGSSDQLVKPESYITETVDSLDIEGLITKIVGKFVEKNE